MFFDSGKFLDKNLPEYGNSCGEIYITACSLVFFIPILVVLTSSISFSTIPFLTLSSIYFTGLVLTYIRTAFIAARMDETHRFLMLYFTFIWPGFWVISFILELVVGLFICASKLLSLLYSYHVILANKLSNFKNLLPERKLKFVRANPPPPRDPYRSLPACDSCGKVL